MKYVQIKSDFFYKANLLRIKLKNKSRTKQSTILKNIIRVVGCCGVNAVVLRVDVDVVFGIVVVVLVVDTGVVVAAIGVE